MQLKLLCILSMVLICVASCKKDTTPPISTPITSDDFKTNAAGWTISGDAQGGYTDVSYSPGGGVTDGYIFANDDVTGGVWYYQAPSDYHGDKSNYYNATLQISLFQHADMTNQFEDRDIIFESGSKDIYCQLPSHPDTTWTNYKITINENAGWFIGAYGSTQKATQSEIKEILSNVTGFFIRGEFETGTDTGGMDNIAIVK